MPTIWKFQIEVKDVQTVSMPRRSDSLTVQVQHGVPCVWALVDAEEPMADRTFEVFGTGHPVPEIDNVERRYVGTFQMHGGSLVFHLFERVELN